MQCPKCGQQAAAATNCGFYLAKWKFTGLTLKGENIEKEGKTTTRNYHTWEAGDDIKWAVLKVKVDPYTP